MLYAPLVIALGAVDSAAGLPAFLLVVAVTGAYLARNAAGLLIRQRGKEGTTFWLGVFLAVFLLSLVPLLAVYHRIELLQVGLAAGALFLLHSLLLVWPSRRRLDRSLWGEILAVGALALTAPAAWIAVGSAPDGRMWLIWAACTLFFSSSVFFVKMLLAAARIKGAFQAANRWRAGRDNLLYHSLLTPAIAAASLLLGGWGGACVALAYLPILLRAFVGWHRLSNTLPPLKRVGILEVIYSLWFTGFFLAAVRTL